MLTAAYPQSELADAAAYLKQLREVVTAFIDLAPSPHVAFLQAVLRLPRLTEAKQMEISDGETPSKILATIGVDQSEAMGKIVDYAKALLEMFPKSCVAGDTHSYVQYQQHPAAGD